MSAKKIKKVEKKGATWLNIIDPSDSKNFFMKNLWFFVAFFVPFILMYIFFAIANVSPYGTEQILVTDLWHQYYPFLVDFQDKLQEGGSLLWTWKSGGGTNYIALMAYYLASPLNFLSVLVPAEYLREFLAVITCAKIGFAGLFFAQFLRITFKKRDISVAVFSIMYALCSFIMGYYWNVIWLDTVALLPLVVAGTVALLRDGKFKLYVISLALSVLANYYIGLFTCIFVLLISIVYCIVEYKNIKTLFVNFFKMAGFSALALSITAILTVPTAIALQSTHSSNNTFPTTYAINIGDTADFKGTMQALSKVIANSVAFIEPTAKEGLPNIYCGVIALVLGIMFLTCSKIKIRERIAGGALLLFFMLSFIIRQLDYIWHGFHFPNMLPHRFSFLFSFVLIAMAYRLFMNLEHIKALNVIITIILFAGVIILAGEYHENKVVIATVFIAVLVFAWLLLFITRTVPKEAVALALFIICVAEAACTVHIGVKTVGTTTTTSYPLGTEDTMKAVDYIDRAEIANEDLFRTEVTKYHTLNDNALIGINGISMFSSVANADVTAYMEKFGLCGWVSSNRYTYQENTPFTNVMLNLKYLISPKGYYLDQTHNTVEYQSGNVKVLKNNCYIPQGFMVSEELLDYDVEYASANPFDNQNEIFRLATGLKGNLYESLEVVSQGHTDYEKFSVKKNSYGSYTYNLIDENTSPHLKYNYTAPYDGTAYIYFQCSDSDSCDLRINDDTVTTNYIKRPYIMQMGNVSEGDKLSVYSDLSTVTTGNAYVYCNMLNEELFLQGVEKLSQSVLNCTKSTDTLIEGTIDVKEDGLFYTSISFDKGWKAYVDGEEVEITPVCDALVAFKLSSGQHDIRLKYCPVGFPLGLTVTLVGIAVFVGIILLGTKIRAKKEKAKTAKTTEE
ncbi:MAG: YfhO family protein [Ruminococcus sp.]|nr:YfhO family protein [Ruminococcus sp.]